MRKAELSSAQDVETDYYCGIALAHLQRLYEARQLLLAGRHLQPRDKRFPTELAGIAFEQKHYSEAARWLRRALRIDPHDTYANDFLATIYFLQGNLEAALKYWNRTGKPRIENVSISPEPQVNPALLDHEMTFSPASVIRLEDLLTSEKRLRGMGIFPRVNFQLDARNDGRFDMNIYAEEKNGFGPNRWSALLSTFRGAFYDTIYAEYFNARKSGRNITSLARWDPQKRRLALSYSSPLEDNPKYRYTLGIDLRNENWAITPSSQASAPILGALNLQTQVLKVGISSFNSSRWDWFMGAELSNRQYRNVFNGSALAPPVLLSGYELTHIARLNYDFLRIPESRFLATASASEQTARIWSNPAHLVERMQGSLKARWLPEIRGDDYAVQEQVRAGKIFGEVPFDELFMLGLERDNDLVMRAHVGTREGRKGSAPLGRNYFLSNWEIDKNIYHNGIFSAKLSPFLDTGKMTDALPGLGSRNWLWDTGIQAKLSIFGMGLKFTYGKDLHSGSNAFYFSAQPW